MRRTTAPLASAFRLAGPRARRPAGRWPHALGPRPVEPGCRTGPGAPRAARPGRCRGAPRASRPARTPPDRPGRLAPPTRRASGGCRRRACRIRPGPGARAARSFSMGCRTPRLRAGTPVACVHEEAEPLSATWRPGDPRAGPACREPGSPTGSRGRVRTSLDTVRRGSGSCCPPHPSGRFALPARRENEGVAARRPLDRTASRPRLGRCCAGHETTGSLRNPAPGSAPAPWAAGRALAPGSAAPAVRAAGEGESLSRPPGGRPTDGARNHPLRANPSGVDPRRCGRAPALAPRARPAIGQAAARARRPGRRA